LRQSKQKTRNEYIPKFTSIESIETFKEYSTIFNSGKFNTGFGQYRTFYVPKEGDIIDEKIAQIMNESKLKIKFKRINNKTYQFGAKKINCKIVSDRLVVRTGGGFVSFEQFLEKYGKLEEMKHLKALSNKKMIENIMSLGRHSPEY
jgi:hypothetical protein